jgi:hypothetical protein
MALSSRLLAACGAALLMLLSVDAAALNALEVAVLVTPKQPKLSQLTLETLVDTSGAAVLSGLVRSVLLEG